MHRIGGDLGPMAGLAQNPWRVPALALSAFGLADRGRGFGAADEGLELPAAGSSVRVWASSTNWARRRGRAGSCWRAASHLTDEGLLVPRAATICARSCRSKASVSLVRAWTWCGRGVGTGIS
jgi:hypothetical protein